MFLKGRLPGTVLRVTSPPTPGRSALRLLAAGLAPLLALGLLPPAQAADAPRRLSYAKWDSNAALRDGDRDGAIVKRGSVRIGDPAGTTRYNDPHGGADRSYDFAHWTSPWTKTDYDFTELVPSWTASTPKGTWLRVLVRARTAGGRTGSWDNLGRWSSGDAVVRRNTLGSQTDDLGRVATDTWQATTAVRAWQLRVTLFRTDGTTATPRLDSVGAMTSRVPNVAGVSTSKTTMNNRRVLDVRSFSQMIHKGEYPKYGGGGEAWCSPTSTAMVLAYYDALPKAKEYAWVDKSYSDRVVDHVARMTYDYEYDGTGNWPFNTAYAGTRTDHAFVTRLRSLRDAEKFIKKGIPLITSITFGSGQLDGAPIGSTAGHLLVVVGFTASGDVIVNDPAAPKNSSVRRTYDRGQFEDAWLKDSSSAGGSGGLTYVIHDDDHPLPRRKASSSW